jgi:membrane-associated phospholipid phosphatase
MVQFVLVLLVFLCGLSRIRDNKHHWTDVISGHAIGVFFAFFFVLRVLELHLVNLSVKESRTDDTNIEQSDDVERGGTS